ncbi:hypothetical protein [Mycolicibacter acidiphilus]|uniref:hypothetical protein n=1 Tax=Mycolicibacter acidiphilus TaxID=2835306 RepID=UPI0027DC5EB7|nr:hypothetical protein [Mycolicibacter acidiphilus]
MAYSLWIRRDTWWTRWEVGATMTIALEGVALLLTSPVLAAELSPLLHRAVWLWNVQHLLGVISLVLALTANSYHAMVRVADPDQVRALMRKHLRIPVWGGIAALTALFIVADEQHHSDLNSAPVTTTWLALYRLVACVLLMFLFGYAGRVTLILRSDARAKTTVRLYVASAACGVASCIALLVGTWTGADMTLPIWLSASLAVAVYAYGSARSWQAKAAWFTSGTDLDLQSSRPPTQS